MCDSKTTTSKLLHSKDYQPTLTTKFHTPPSEKSSHDSTNNHIDDEYHSEDTNYYQSNPTIFGRILEGSEPSRPFLETSRLYSFSDKNPKARLHALIIPKQFIVSISQLPTDQKWLLLEMQEMAIDILQQNFPQKVIDDKDYKLCFHVPPFISVGHLHLHVLAPVSEMDWKYRYIKYLCGTPWCIEMDQALKKFH